MIHGGLKSILILGLLVPLASAAGADMGAPILAVRAGNFEVRVLVTPAPLRTGTSEWNVLVKDAASGRVLLDAEVELELSLPLDRPDADHASHEEAHPHERTTVSASLAPEQASNRLFHAATLALAAPGAWTGRLRISRGASSATIPFEVDVEPARSSWQLHWQAFTIAPVGLLAFGLHQRLVRRSKR